MFVTEMVPLVYILVSGVAAGRGLVVPPPRAVGFKGWANGNFKQKKIMLTKF